MDTFHVTKSFLLTVFRLKTVDVVLSGLETMRQLVADYEIALVSHDNMTSDPQALRNLREELHVCTSLTTAQM